MKTLYIECNMGAAGDMLMAALLELTGDREGFIKKMMKASGKSDIDVLCTFLAGDTIGMALSFVKGIIIKTWNFLKEKGVLKLVLKIIKGLFSLGMMLGTIHIRLLRSLKAGFKKLIKG